MYTDRNEIGIQLIIGIILTLCCFSFFHFLFPHHLLVKEQTQLFLLTTDFFIGYFSKPAFLACYAGDFLTQFFYLRVIGTVVITAVIVLEWLLFTQALYRIGIRKAALLALIPVVAECLLHTQLEYPLSATVAVIIVLLVFLLYTYIPNRGVSIVAGLLFIPLLYTIAGDAFLLFPVLVIWFEVNRWKWSWIYGFLLICACGVYPHLVRHHYLLTVQQSYLYPHQSERMDVPGSRMIKQLAETHLMLGDSSATYKYLHILEKTMFYRDWAREQKQKK